MKRAAALAAALFASLALAQPKDEAAEDEAAQQALAKKARLSVSYVSMLERGVRVPPLDTLEVIAKSLGVAPLYLCQELSAPRAGRTGR